MGIIKVHEFATVDGVTDAPMWTMDYGFTDEMSDALGELTGTCSGLLLGRVTYEMFAPAWSSRTVEDDPGAPFFNESPKFVVSSTLESGDWNNTEIIGGYDPQKIADLKVASPGDLYISGSNTLVRALLVDGLVDELHLFVYPVAVGEGVRLFPQGGPKLPLTLLRAQPFENGVTQMVYGPAS